MVLEKKKKEETSQIETMKPKNEMKIVMCES